MLSESIEARVTRIEANMAFRHGRDRAMLCVAELADNYPEIKMRTVLRKLALQILALNQEDDHEVKS